MTLGLIDSDVILIWQTILLFIVGLLTVIMYAIINKTTKQIAKDSEKSNRINILNDRMQTILKTAIDYPYVLIQSIIKNLVQTDNLEDAMTIRYYAYCAIVFNFLEEVFRYFAGDRKLIDEYCNIKSIVLTHKDWWIKKTISNRESYPLNFRTMIQEIINNDVSSQIQIVEKSLHFQ